MRRTPTRSSKNSSKTKRTGTEDASTSDSSAPLYEKVDVAVTYDGAGATYVDPYRWMQNREDPQVTKKLQKENALVEQFFASREQTAPGFSRKKLFAEMKARWKEADVSLPSADRHYWYYTRTVPHAEHSLYCRRPYDKEKGVNANFMHEVAALLTADPRAVLPAYDDEVVFLDVNLLQAELKLDFIEVGDIDISPDERRAAVTVDCSNGNETYTLFVLSIRDVNFARWLAEDAGAVQQAWAEDQCRQSQSPYTPVTPSSLASPLGRFPTGRQHGGRAGGSGSPGSGTNSPTTTTTTGTGRPRPRHHVLHRIDIFDLSASVMWLCDDSLLYLAQDDKSRPYQLVHHSLALEEKGDAAGASTICFEEENEAFWLNLPSWSADYQYLICATSSSELTEVFVVPAWWDSGRDAWHERVHGSGRGKFHCPTLQGIPFLTRQAREEWERSAGSDREDARMPPTRCFASFRELADADPATAVEFELDHHPSLLGPDADSGGGWVIVSNAQGHTNFAVFYVPDSHFDESLFCEDAEAHGTLCSPDVWQPLFAQDPSVKVDGVECYRDFLLVSVRRRGTATVLLCRMEQLWAAAASLPLPLDALVDLSATVAERSGIRGTQGHTLFAHFHAEPLPFSMEACGFSSLFDASSFRLDVTHSVFPNVVFEFTPGSGALRKLREELVCDPHFTADAYDGCLVWVPSEFAFEQHDGIEKVPTHRPSPAVRIPVLAVWRSDRFAPGENFCLADVYGAYGDCSDPEFSSTQLTLLDRGIVCVSALVRGGGELGIPWRDEGRKLQRGTTVNDFLSVAAFLPHAGICGAGRLMAVGGSAGGMVVCRAMLQAPQLFHAVIGMVPFVDCLGSLLQEELPLTVTEWDDYGNPQESPEAFRSIQALSPVDNVHRVTPGAPWFPHVYLETSFDDTRVGYWEAMKLTARLRECKPPESVLLHYCNFSGGHGGASGRYEMLHEVAREYAFVLYATTLPPFSQ